MIFDASASSARNGPELDTELGLRLPGSHLHKLHGQLNTPATLLHRLTPNDNRHLLPPYDPAKIAESLEDRCKLTRAGKAAGRDVTTPDDLVEGMCVRFMPLTCSM